MSSDEGPGGSRADRGATGDASVAPQLLSEIGSTTRDRTPQDVMARVDDALADADVAHIDEELVTQSLDELLLALIALREDETHGTGLMEDVATLFDVDPSPGTVYPRLHDLEAAGTLARHDLVRTKQYVVDDESAAAERIEAAASQHLAVGLFLHAAGQAL